MKRIIGTVFGLLAPLTLLASVLLALWLSHAHKPNWLAVDGALACALLIVLGMVLWLVSVRWADHSSIPRK